eukprot:15658579-Heterocapsa_arctica.AAC.1
MGQKQMYTCTLWRDRILRQSRGHCRWTLQGNPVRAGRHRRALWTTKWALNNAPTAHKGE